STEILLDIFETAIDNNFKGRKSRATLAALARTCRTFKEPALDTLWKNINGFEPLISCLPEGVVERTTEGMLTLTRPLSLSDWNIIDNRVMQALVCTPSSALFPNLRCLEWWDEPEYFFPLLRILLVATIRSLKFGSRYPWVPSFAKSSLLASLGARCPSIQHFVCDYGGDSDAICELVCGWQGLSYLRTGVLEPPSLHFLTSLPSLKSLQFKILDDSDDTQSTLTFSQLDKVDIIAPAHHCFTRRLRNLRFPSCRSAVLVTMDNDAAFQYEELLELYDESPDIPNFMVSFSECFSPDLEQIELDFTQLGEDSGPLVLDFDMVAPLLTFSRLTKLDLNSFSTATIDDDALKKMAHSWPQLEKFYFGTADHELVSPSLTFIGLIHLIRHCRHLCDIAMSFCASSMDTDCELFSQTIPNEKITRMRVGISPIADHVAVA
ncbi:hypothetical protein AZE42_08536, partial [Rhizopogon vesiculosus]